MLELLKRDYFILSYQLSLHKKIFNHHIMIVCLELQLMIRVSIDSSVEDFPLSAQLIVCLRNNRKLRDTSHRFSSSPILHTGFEFSSLRKMVSDKSNSQHEKTASSSSDHRLQMTINKGIEPQTPERLESSLRDKDTVHAQKANNWFCTCPQYYANYWSLTCFPF